MILAGHSEKSAATKASRRFKDAEITSAIDDAVLGQAAKECEYGNSDSAQQLRQRDIKSLRDFFHFAEARLLPSVLQLAEVADIHADTVRQLLLSEPVLATNPAEIAAELLADTRCHTCSIGDSLDSHHWL